MTQPALIIMAGGIGSRYGGLKQVDPIGPNGEIIIDYSVYDALQAGFGKVVFLIRKEIEDIFREKIGRKIEQRAETVYVYQSIQDVPSGFTIPEERKRPWGTAHAVLCCKDVIAEPFAAINADDFYGRHAFDVLGKYLSAAQDTDVYDYSMVGYRLDNTLSDSGSVARGICQVSPEGYLMGVVERVRIERVDGQPKFTENGQDWIALPPESTVSMNMWGFTPSFMGQLERRFPIFLRDCIEHGDFPLKSEFFLPSVVNQLIEEGKARVHVLPTNAKWFGVTNPEDRPVVQAAIRSLVERGEYPADLWG